MSQALPDELAWRLLETMLLMRRFEEGVIRLAQEKRFAGHYHVYIGQEATGAGAIAALAPGDHLATTHRNHGHLIARGADPGRAMAEILGRAAGLNGGRGGTFHLTEPALGFLSTSAIVGGCISLAVGGGYACKRRRDGSVTMAFFGDGALEEGISFEAMNIAALWRLPVIFLCENNSAEALGVGQGGAPSSTHACKDLRRIAETLAIPAERVDGADVGAVHASARAAVARCRRGDGPVFIEAVTQRWAGSAALMPELSTGITDLRMATGEAPSDGPHRQWHEERDSVLRLARTLAAGGAQAKGRIHALDRDVQARIEEAVAFALASPYPASESALDHVFAAGAPAP